MVRSMLALGLGAALLAHASGCTDYAYAHDVQGRVVDAQDRPVGGASVTRVRDAAQPEVFGAAHLYQRTTMPDGRFAFTYDGLGGKPEPTHTWHLRADAPGCQPGSATVTIPLDRGSYVAKDVVLRVRCDPAPSIPSSQPERKR